MGNFPFKHNKTIFKIVDCGK